jgi:hypothetical protein
MEGKEGKEVKVGEVGEAREVLWNDRACWKGDL